MRPPRQPAEGDLGDLQNDLNSRKTIPHRNVHYLEEEVAPGAVEIEN